MYGNIGARMDTGRAITASIDESRSRSRNGIEQECALDISRVMYTRGVCKTGLSTDVGVCA